MRKMAELQLTVVTDPRSRQAIIKQIHQWEENLEKLYIEQYRLRCYSHSIQGSELPNPKVQLCKTIVFLYNYLELERLKSTVAIFTMTI